MKRRLSLVVEDIERDLELEENVHHDVLSVVTSHMEGSASMVIHRIRLGVVEVWEVVDGRGRELVGVVSGL